MKFLILALLFLNVAAYTWFSQRPAVDPARLPASAAVPAGAVRLQRLQEVGVAVAESRAPKVDFLDAYCFSIGPLDGVVSGRELRSRLEQDLPDLGLQLRREEYRELSGYWVFLPPGDDREDALRITSQLKDKGITEFLIVPSGPKRNAVSLGFFRQEASARSHFARLRKLGFAPILEESYRTGERFWLDFTAFDSNPLPDSLIRELYDRHEYEVSRRDCAAPLRRADGQVDR